MTDSQFTELRALAEQMAENQAIIEAKDGRSASV